MQKNIVNSDMAVITLPMKPHRKEKIGMIVIPSIADVLAKRIGAKSYLGINLMDSYVKRSDFVDDYYNLLYQMDIDVDDIEVDEDSIVIYGKPQDLNGMKAAIISKLPNAEFDLDEITYIPKEKVELSGDDLEIFNRAITLLDDVEDVQHVYHNVIL